MTKQLSKYDVGAIDGKTVQHAFWVYNQIYIGFTDGTWLGLRAENEPECGTAELMNAPGLEDLPDLLENFQWDVVAEFEKAGIVTDGDELRSVLRAMRVAFLRRDKADTERRLAAMVQELKEIEGSDRCLPEV